LADFRVFDHFQDGKIEQDTEQFFELEEIARARLRIIKKTAGRGVLAKLKRHVALSKLNALLSFYGWAIRRDGQMFEVRVRGEPVDLKLDEKPQHPHGSIEDINERARQFYTNTGIVMDPRDGKRLPHSERARFGIT
jgi:hypothetical protein